MRAVSPSAQRGAGRAWMLAHWVGAVGFGDVCVRTCAHTHTHTRALPQHSLFSAHHVITDQLLQLHRLEVQGAGSTMLAQHPADGPGLRLHAWAGADPCLTVQNWAERRNPKHRKKGTAERFDSRQFTPGL